MTSKTENHRLTRVEDDAPLGQMLRRNFWIPFARSQSLAPGGPPQRVRLLGTDLVAFRGEDGTLGLMDELCPHRRASLALARVEGCSLRCIYHGWRMGADGTVVEVPSEGERSDEFAAQIERNHYGVREGGGLLWAFLGQDEAPELPPLPFLKVPEESRWWCRMMVDCNWLQGFEGALDSVHLNWLHQGWQKDKGDSVLEAYPRLTPDYEIERTDYGLRTCAVRKASEEETHFRCAEFIAPFYAFSASRQPVIASDCSVFISVPVDDTTHMLFFGFWDEIGPLTDISGFFPDELDHDNLISDEFLPHNCWGQDREAMAQGHFSGFTKSVLHEDVGVQTSMGPIVERSEENLCSTDLAIVRTREFLLEVIAEFEAGRAVDGEMAAYRDGGNLPFSCSAPVGSDWRNIGFRAHEPAE
ncbi:MAG: Rieske 2Fe-2S domain-containing protein [Novosphingobium sp.]|nr:Rieske 2Fe-2S domain-containing protein [Novosphingobium sp.]